MTVAYICDIILVLILLVGIINGTRMGFVQSLVGLLLGVISIVVIVAFLNPVRTFLLRFIDLNKIVGDTGNIWKDYILAASNYLVATILIFTVLSIINAIILRIARIRIEDRRIDSPTFAKWDRWLGLLAGAIRGTVTCVLISLIISQPLFFPTMQEDIAKTTITSFVYEKTEYVLQETTGMNDDELTNAMISYFMGSDIEDAKEESSEYRMIKITSMVLEFQDLTGDPQAFIEKNGDVGVRKLVIYLSAIADITAMSPKNENLDKKFLTIYDELVSYIPQDEKLLFTREQYDDMFDPVDGSFYNVRLEDYRVEKIRDKVCIEVCYE